MIYYHIALGLSFILSIIFLYRSDKYTNPLITIIFCVIPISNLGYYLLASTTNINGAIVANKIIYLGGCFMHLLTLFFILTVCKIRRKRWIVVIAFIYSTLIYVLLVTDEIHHMFYKSVRLSQRHGIAYMQKEYGPFHTLFYLMLFVYLFIDICVIIYGFRKKNEASIKEMALLISMVSVNMFAFFVGRLVWREIELMAYAYIMDQILFMIMEKRKMLYNAEEIISDILLRRNELGFIAFDDKMNYLGADDMMRRWFPQMKFLRVDRRPDENSGFYKGIKAQVDLIEETGKETEYLFHYGEHYFKVKGDFLIFNHTKRGYYFLFEDDTKEQIKINHVVYEKEHDAMTGLYNKGKYMELMGSVYQTLSSITILNMDVNNLKKVNDTYGHEAGDALIINAAKSLLSIQTEKVKGFRLGGDEFILIGENLSREEAIALKKEWHQAVDAINELETDLKMVIACGMVYGEKGYNLTELLKQADANMYEEKKRLKAEALI